MRCRICSSPKRIAIEQACATSPAAEVATTFRLSETSLTKHLDSHPRAAATEASQRPEASPRAPSPETIPSPPPSDDPPDTVRSKRLEQSARANVRRITSTVEDLLEEAQKSVLATYAEKASLARAALAANRQLALLTGELGVSEASILASPTVQRLLGNIVEALKPYPDAARAVLATLGDRAEAA